jgi:hypothetical protein
MTPVDWNDNEPTFPDFLPPSTPNARLTQDAAQARIKGILEAAGVRGAIVVGPAGSYVYLDFPDGAVYSECGLFVSAEGYTRR